MAVRSYVSPSAANTGSSMSFLDKQQQYSPGISKITLSTLFSVVVAVIGGTGDGVAVDGNVS